MKPVEEFHQISDQLCIWQAYNPEVKVDCTSTAVRMPDGWVIIDPTPLRKEALAELLGEERCAGILLSSGNHQRASREMAAQLGVKIFAPVTTRSELTADEWFTDRVLGLETFPLPGAAVGETAFLRDDTVIVGDALIHLGELMILPDKYCEDAKLLRRSLTALAERSFSTICFAHGLPITSAGRKRVAGLL